MQDSDLIICTDTTDPSEFLKLFPFPPPLYRRTSDFISSYVFWSEFENYSFSDDLGAGDKIKYALGCLPGYPNFLAQFWAPVTIYGRRLLSTLDQPFAVNHPCVDLALYRLYSDNYMYIIDDHQFEEENHMIISSGGPATAFLNRFPSFTKLEWFPWPSDPLLQLNFSLMLPICLHPQSSCIGVLEFTMDASAFSLEHQFLKIVTAVKEAGLDVFYVKDLIPYKTINGLKHAKDEIEDALKIVCESHNIALAQVWINYVEENHVPFSSLEAAQAQQLLALKLTGFYALTKTSFPNYFDTYSKFCDVTPRQVEEEPVFETLQDYESRYSPWKYCDEEAFIVCVLAICLRSTDTDDCNYAFEFLWIRHSNPFKLLEDLLLTLKRCLPRFKFASGAQIGDELDVIVKLPNKLNVNTGVESETYREMWGFSDTKSFKIFQGKNLSPTLKALDNGKQPMAMNDKKRPRSKGRPKNAPFELSIEKVEKQFGKTMEDAGKALGVSRSTLRRWWNKHTEDTGQSWQGPKQMKGSKTNEKVINSAIQEPLGGNINQNTVTIKAEYAGEKIVFPLPILQVGTFAALKNEINTEFKLSPENYKLKYRDKDEDLMRLSSDKDINYCIQNLRKSDPKVVRVLVLTSP